MTRRATAAHRDACVVCGWAEPVASAADPWSGARPGAPGLHEARWAYARVGVADPRVGGALPAPAAWPALAGGDRVLFLDMDGVLNSRRTRARAGDGLAAWIDPDNVVHLVRLVRATALKLVVSSTWREGLTVGALGKLLRGVGIAAPVIGATPVHDSGPRWQEIQAWLDAAAPPPGPWAIVDDIPEMGPLSARHVRTFMLRGLGAEELPALVALLAPLPPGWSELAGDGAAVAAEAAEAGDGAAAAAALPAEPWLGAAAPRAVAVGPGGEHLVELDGPAAAVAVVAPGGGRAGTTIWSSRWQWIEAISAGRARR